MPYGSCLTARHGKPFGFPNSGVRHGCHCALLFRGRQPSLGRDTIWLGQVIHVRSAGVFSDTHTPDKYFSYCSGHILHSGVSMLGKPNIPHVRQDKACHRQRRTAVPGHDIPPCEGFVGSWKRHHGRVGIAGLLCHHHPKPYGFTFESALWFQV